MATANRRIDAARGIYSPIQGNALRPESGALQGSHPGLAAPAGSNPRGWPARRLAPPSSFRASLAAPAGSNRSAAILAPAADSRPQRSHRWKAVRVAASELGRSNSEDPGDGQWLTPLTHEPLNLVRGTRRPDHQPLVAVLVGQLHEIEALERAPVALLEP